MKNDSAKIAWNFFYMHLWKKKIINKKKIPSSRAWACNCSRAQGAFAQKFLSIKEKKSAPRQKRIDFSRHDSAKFWDKRVFSQSVLVFPKKFIILFLTVSKNNDPRKLIRYSTCLSKEICQKFELLFYCVNE